jgi:hypothetical protein
MAPSAFPLTLGGAVVISDANMVSVPSVTQVKVFNVTLATARSREGAVVLLCCLAG